MSTKTTTPAKLAKRLNADVLRIETAATIHAKGKDRPIVVELRPGYMTLGPKGLSGERYTVDYVSVFWLAAKKSVK